MPLKKCECETIEYSFNGIELTVKNAKRVEFSADDIRDVEHPMKSYTTEQKLTIYP